MSYGSPADNIIVQLTDKARELCARQSVEGLSFIFDSWAMGRGGYKDANPVEVYPIDPSQTTLIDQIYPDPINRVPLYDGDFEFPTKRSVSIAIRIPRETVAANFAMGEIGIWVKIIDSPNPTEIGEYHLFMVAHFPIQVITYNSSKVYRLIGNF